MEHSWVTGFAILEMAAMLLISLPLLLGGIALAKYLSLSSEICGIADRGILTLEREPMTLLASAAPGVREPGRISTLVDDLAKESTAVTGLKESEVRVEGCLWVLQDKQVGQAVCQQAGNLPTPENFNADTPPSRSETGLPAGVAAIAGISVSALTHLEAFGLQEKIQCKRVRAARNEVVL